MSIERMGENRFATTTTYTGTPEELAKWETEQRANFQRDGITDFEVTYGVATVTVSYNFASPKVGESEAQP